MTGKGSAAGKDAPDSYPAGAYFIVTSTLSRAGRLAVEGHPEALHGAVLFLKGFATDHIRDSEWEERWADLIQEIPREARSGDEDVPVSIRYRQIELLIRVFMDMDLLKEPGLEAGPVEAFSPERDVYGIHDSPGENVQDQG